MSSLYACCRILKYDTLFIWNSKLLSTLFKYLRIWLCFGYLCTVNDLVKQIRQIQLGKLVDKLIASYLSMPSIDIRVMLSSTN